MYQSDIIVDGHNRGTKVNERRMRADDDLQTLKSTFQPLSGVQYVRRNNERLSWAGRRWRFDDVKEATQHTDTSPDYTSLGTLVVCVRRCIRVMETKLQMSSLAKDNTVQNQHYGKHEMSDRCLEKVGITNLVTFGPEETFPTESGWRSERVTDTSNPIERYTFTDSENAPFAKFVFHYRSLGEPLIALNKLIAQN
jgi:hypothetical protein